MSVRGLARRLVRDNNEHDSGLELFPTISLNKFPSKCHSQALCELVTSHKRSTGHWTFQVANTTENTGGGTASSC